MWLRSHHDSAPLLFPEQEDQQDQNRIGNSDLGWARMGDVICPRCGTKMRWIRRVNTYFCDKDGYLLGKDDPFVQKGEVVPAYNPGGDYNH